MLADVRPAPLVVPVGERARLPQLVLGIPAELRRLRARRRLVAAQPGDPRVETGERTVQRLDLADRAAEVRVPLPELLAVHRRLPSERRPFVDLDLRAVALLDLAPDRVRLRKEDMRVEREHARPRLEREEHVEQDRLLLLKRARERNAAGKLVEQEGENLLRRPGLD